MPSLQGPIPVPSPKGTTTRDAVCMGCGCSCDDIEVVSHDHNIISTNRVCDLGRSWYDGRGAINQAPAAAIEGNPADFAAAVARAGDLIHRARRPLFLGIGSCSIEAQRLLISLAERAQGLVDFESGNEAIEAMQRVGEISGTLGEAKQRSEVVVFWRCDPLRTHPRHFERYSVEPAGRFLPNGRADRKILVADSEPTATAAKADVFLRIDPDREIETLWALRALARGRGVDRERFEARTGLVFKDLEDWNQELVRVRHGTIFWDGASMPIKSKSMHIESLLKWTRDLNSGRRFLSIALGRPGNGSGGHAVAAWRSGFASSLDFGRGIANSWPDHPSWRPENGDFDLVVAIGDDTRTQLAQMSISASEQILSVFIAPAATTAGSTATVAIRSAAFGIDEGGTLMRVDGVMLPVVPLYATDRPTVSAILDAILSIM